jgi:hypothetical protein
MTDLNIRIIKTNAALKLSMLIIKLKKNNVAQQK